MKRLLVPLGLFLVIAAMGILFLPSSSRMPHSMPAGGQSPIPHVVANEASITAKAADEKTIVPEAIATAAGASVMQDHDLHKTQHECAEVSAAGQPEWVISVPVATLWVSPGETRLIDRASIGASADIMDWIRSMAIADKLWLVGRLETQALLGTKVIVLDRRGDWVKVAIPEQATPKDARGYTGWLPKEQLTEQRVIYERCPLVTISAPTTALYDGAYTDMVYKVASFNTTLPLVAREQERLGVAVPGAEKLKWLKVQDGRIEPAPAAHKQTAFKGDIPHVSGDQLVQTAKQFLNLPYLWSGTSGFGFDCSGLMYTIHRYYGIWIPRDAKDQAASGRKVETADLMPGDLLFYAYNNGKGKVHHVAMYIGSGQMIHSPKTERSVEIIAMNTPEYAGARRYY
ncbi:C40 family peptidase [Paenibacillus rigui]|uniref:Peptidase P60 n=1 Tax=Paenibacillus rigui TaxID=554312 RepID=A0A229UWI7_9BACL|nr:C40 family peptidase [Paenibacillus rigui]OXM87897.1 peptidase P60 [Paenibacillus rigui]